MAGQQIMTQNEAAHDEGEQAEIKRVETVTVRRHYDSNDNWIPEMTITESVRKAGLSPGDSIRYIPGELEELGLVPALGFPKGDGRVDRFARKITRAGNERGDAYRANIPMHVLEAMGIEEHEIGGDDPVKLTVYAGDRLLAFEPFDGREIPSLNVDEPTGVEKTPFEELFEDYDQIGDLTAERCEEEFGSIEDLADDVINGGEIVKEFPRIGEKRYQAIVDALVEGGHLTEDNL
ncbi:hypothetical protein [Natrarchaeobaculum sulfurireducens]|uniref:Uncharacterized protein n=1 Tax=Natrarchaeobaculum sulfurireducens TaxID=2044521 RepID=A0A346PK65_9EURY|nr:hypothetical protein [Natrarchaeobaculum sulfurireducens]AXR79910.1 hypothetical protein AArcMg_4085 [Natrarchaeobaculum sulfurireducens]